MRIVVVVLLALHGLIHLIGVVKEWRGVPPKGMSGVTLFTLPPPWPKVVGALWLIVALGFIAAAAMLWLRNAGWCWVAAVAVGLSQLLIIYAWPDAKAGTLANLLLVVAMIVAMGAQRFDRTSQAAVDAMLQRAACASSTPVRDDELAHLPPPVARWLKAAGIVGLRRDCVVRIEQTGEMKTAVDGAFMPTTATQTFTTTPPAFVWNAHVSMFQLPILGRDSYLNDHGNMLIAAGGLVPVVDARGPEVDQGTLLRFVGELVWFPSAALSPDIQWTAIDDLSARATMSRGGVTVNATFHIDHAGRVVDLQADRYMAQGDAKKTATLERWGNRSLSWQRMDGVLVPTSGEVYWDLKSGRFVYYRWSITKLARNPKR